MKKTNIKCFSRGVVIPFKWELLDGAVEAIIQTRYVQIDRMDTTLRRLELSCCVIQAILRYALRGSVRQDRIQNRRSGIKRK